MPGALFSPPGRRWPRSGRMRGPAKRAAAGFCCAAGPTFAATSPSSIGDNRRIALKISDAKRAEDLPRNTRDKRLTYRQIGEAGYA